MSWRVARSLDKLLAQINAYAPRRSKISDGSIGDASHSARASDHNPDNRGVVHARDFTHDPRGGFDAHAFVRRLARAGDRRIKYLISNRQISNPSIGGGRWRPYSGSNAHTRHAHVSCVYGALEDNTAPWPGLSGTASAGGSTTTTPTEGNTVVKAKAGKGSSTTFPVSNNGFSQMPYSKGKYTLATVSGGVLHIESFWRLEGLPAGKEVQVRYLVLEYHNWKKFSSVLKNGSRGAEVGVLQRFLGIKDDDIFGSATKSALAKWQGKKGIIVDGEAGKETRAHLPTNRRVTTYSSQLQEIIGTGGGSYAHTVFEAWPAKKSGQDLRVRVELQTFTEGVAVTRQSHRITKFE